MTSGSYDNSKWKSGRAADAPVLKTGVPSRGPWVRILPLPKTQSPAFRLGFVFSEESEPNGRLTCRIRRVLRCRRQQNPGGILNKFPARQRFLFSLSFLVLEESEPNGRLTCRIRRVLRCRRQQNPGGILNKFPARQRFLFSLSFLVLEESEPNGRLTCRIRRVLRCRRQQNPGGILNKFPARQRFLFSLSFLVFGREQASRSHFVRAHHCLWLFSCNGATKQQRYYLLFNELVNPACQWALRAAHLCLGLF